MKLRLGTFNAENLFARFKFKGVRVKQNGTTSWRPYTQQELDQIAKDGWMVDKTFFTPFDPKTRELTARAIKGLDADVLALQEIEAMDSLKKFSTQFLSASGFKYKCLIDANDPRFIDVAVLSKYPFAYIRTYQYDRTPNNTSYVFSRDCLEVGLELPSGSAFPIFINHFKSMMDGRLQTMPRRKLQAERLVQILNTRFSNNPGAAPWAVLGDLNDYMPSTGLDPLLGQPWLHNVIQRLPASEQWTHYWAKQKEYRQLDYIVLSQTLANANITAVPYIERRGLPKRATHYTGPRFPGVGDNDPKASDHCPVVIEIDV
jgi:endonuclease/exonuclease/phosphatase family metal-dependent hydrolase